MVKGPCCGKQITGGVKKGPWTEDEDKLLVDYIQANGHGSWRLLPKLAGLKRCGKSCRLRWTNYLRPDIKRGPFTRDEQKSIIQLHGIVGNKWSAIAAQLPGRTDNEVKNYWNTHLKKRLQRMGIDTETYTNTSFSPFSAARHMAQWESIRLEAEARLSRQLLNFATTSESTNHNEDTNNPEVAKKEHNDVFLRMWDSDIGKSFRDNVKVVNEESVVSSSSNVNEFEESSDETFKFCMDLGCEDDEFSMFESQMGSCFYSSLFYSDLEEVSLEY